MKIKRNYNWIILISIFVIGVIVHYFYGAFSKSIDVLPDEIRYYSIARSIFQGDGLTFRGVTTDYQKMGYIVFLLPFFYITNGVLRMKMITLFNCIIMMTSIFPLYGIASRLKLSNKAKYLFIAAFLVFPDLMYSATFMAEILYWPLVLLFVYLWMVNREKRSVVLSICLGLICYVGYMTKEIFLAMLISVILFEIFYPIVEYIFNRGQASSLRSLYEGKKFLNAAVVAIVFVVIHIVVKLIFFRGLGNSYDQMGIEAIASPEKVGYMIYGFFYYLAAIMVAVLIMPIIMPGMLYRQLDDRTRGLYIFNILSILTSVATIAYTITVREDFGELIPRLHFRYIGPLILIVLLVFLVCIDREEVKLRVSKGPVITIIVSVFITFGLFRGVVVITGVDQFILDWTYSIIYRLGDLWGLLLVNIVIIVACSLCFAFFVTNKRNVLLYSTIAALIIFGVINSYTAKQRLLDYMYRDEVLVNDVIELNDNLKDVDSGILYIGTDKEYDDICKCMDTFIDKNSNMYYITNISIKDIQEGVYDVKDIVLPMQFGLWKMKYTDIDNIEYVIKNKSNDELGEVDVTNLTEIPEYSNEYYTVYRNNDVTKLCFVDIK